jgi:hypothetical protein
MRAACELPHDPVLGTNGSADTQDRHTEYLSNGQLHQFYGDDDELNDDGDNAASCELRGAIMKPMTKDTTPSNAKKRREHEVEGGTAGALAGATLGAIAGPPGAVAGAVVGAIAGAVAGRVVEGSNEARAAEDEELDREIGVSGGELGAPNLEHPPAKIGAYSGGSAGVGPMDDDESPAEGPIQPPRN